MLGHGFAGFATPDDLGDTAQPHGPIVAVSVVSPSPHGPTDAVAACPDCGWTRHDFDTDGNGVLVSRCGHCGLELKIRGTLVRHMSKTQLCLLVETICREG